ncbi:MAG TPA: STAS/SEC14 domain-containing protein [Polyangium sp.]|nr:STAS/SEC14 domain-containing protein [Polyangium sp.]
MKEVEVNAMPLGTHLAYVDGDRVFVQLRGKLTVDDMQRLYELGVSVKKNNPHVFVLYDGQQGTGIDPDGRKSVPKEQREFVADLRVVYGLSFATRVILNMLVRTQKALFNRDLHTYIFDDEQSARAFFEEESRRIRSGIRADTRGKR